MNVDRRYSVQNLTRQVKLKLMEYFAVLAFPCEVS